MTTLNIGVTAYSVQAAKPGTQYGQLAKIPLRAGSAAAMFWASLEKIPKGATITSAKFQWHVAAAATGTRTLKVNPFTSAWPAQRTWDKRPTQGAGSSAAPVTNPANSRLIEVDVTSLVQERVWGTAKSFGWHLIVEESATLYVRGTTATSGRPMLVVTYTMTPPVPSNLQPSDADISVAKPVLLFDADPFITGLQVQVDPAANGTTPAFDSTQVTASGGLYDLSASSYAGLAAGSTTYWRVRQQTAGGWSDWSGWVPFSRVAAETLTITSPGGTAPVAIADGTPPITWTFSGTQVAWRARLLDISGDVIADSGRQAGTDTDWTPDRGLTETGQGGVIEVSVWPDGNRAATPGAPVESIATLEVVLTPDGTIAQITDVQAANLDVSPTVTVTGHRAQIPDYVVLKRNGKEIDRLPGVDVATPAAGGGYTLTMSDPEAVTNRTTYYRLAAVVNGKQSAADSIASIVPTCTGIWLTSRQDGTRAVIWTGEDQPQAQTELSIVHRPITGSGGVVRRRLMRGKPEGSVSGMVITVGEYTAEDSEANLRAWADPDTSDAGDHYTLALGGYSGRVILGDITFTEVPNQYGERALDVSFNWWEA